MKHAIFLWVAAAALAESMAAVPIAMAQTEAENGSRDHDRSVHLSIISKSKKKAGGFVDQLYGLTGDGVSDDTAALSAAIQRACVSSGSLRLPAGIFSIRPASPAQILPACSGLTVAGTGNRSILRIASHSGDYDSVFGTKTQVLSNVRLSNFTVDMNAENNPPVNYSDLNAHPRLVFAVNPYVPSSGTNNIIQHLHITNVRSVWVFALGSDNSTVADCLIDRVGGGEVSGDSSAVYMIGNGATVIRNRLISIGTGTNMAVTAIETHGSRQKVADNRIQDFQVGANITGISTSTSAGGSVHGNRFSGVLQCIDLWSGDTLGATGAGMSGMLVFGNVCKINQLSWPKLEKAGAQTFGIQIQGDSNLPIENLRVYNNWIKFDLSVSANEPYNSSLATIGIGYLDLTGKNNACNNCRFSGNTVLNCPMAAFRFSAGGTNISFDNNTAVNPGSHLNPAVAGSVRVGLYIGLGKGAGPLYVRGGTYSDRLSVSRMVFGVLITADLNRGTVINGTKVSCQDQRCASLKAAIETRSNEQLSFIDAEVDVPRTAALTKKAAAGSRIRSTRERRVWLSNGLNWTPQGAL